MFWKIISRTIQHIWGLSGFVMEIIGIISNPMGPFGLSILAWGAILFTIWALSVIAQLGWHIHKTENSYIHTLSFDDLVSFPNLQSRHIRYALLFSNTSDKPIEYRIDLNKTYLEIDGKRPTQLQYDSTGGIIQKLKSTKFLLPEVPFPNQLPAQGILHFELDYGSPHNLKFQKIKEVNIELTQPTPQGTIYTIWKDKYEEDKPIKKIKKPIQIKDLNCL